MRQMTLPPAPPTPPIFYPETDGKPMAENTLQFRWIVTLEGGLDFLYMAEPNVFVAGDLLWYPVEGRADICQAPDTMVAFGRPKGHRGSYKQWEEADIAPQVVFEVRSPGNTNPEMAHKFDFYEKYGVEEYYIYDPDRGKLSGWLRKGDRLTPIASMQGWVSPRLGIRFEMVDGELEVYGPDGRKFLTQLESNEQRVAAERRADAEKRLKEKAQRQAEKEKRLKEKAQQGEEEAKRQNEEVKRQNEEAKRREEEAMRQKEEAEQKLAQMLAKLKALGLNPDE